MEDAVVNKIREKISRSRFGSVFFVSSFPEFDIEYVTKLLARFEQDGMITRIAKGIYVKAKRTRFGILYPSAYELAEEIAKRDKAQIIPSGATAENRLGFSTQVPMNTSFLTTGSSRKLAVGSRTITFKHGAPKNFAYRGVLMPVLVQALRSIGENNICERDKKIIERLFAAMPETETIDHDLLLAPAWMRKLIKKNRKETNNE